MLRATWLKPSECINLWAIKGIPLINWINSGYRYILINNWDEYQGSFPFITFYAFNDFNQAWKELERNILDVFDLSAGHEVIQWSIVKDSKSIIHQDEHSKSNPLNLTILKSSFLQGGFLNIYQFKDEDKGWEEMTGNNSLLLIDLSKYKQPIEFP